MKQVRLASGRSASWAFMEKFEVPDYDHPERNYLTRWRLVQTPWFSFYLHRMDGPDPRRTLHDHPWAFVSFVLRGGYIERRLDSNEMNVRLRAVRRINRMPAHGAHAIVRILREPTWTFLFVGRRVRTWGYLEPQIGSVSGAPQWVWTEFNKHYHATEFDKAMAIRKEGAA